MDTELTHKQVSSWISQERERLEKHFSYPVLALNVSSNSRTEEWCANVGYYNTPSHQAGHGPSPTEAVKAAMTRSIEVLASLNTES